jgi:hypothetical protein
MPQQKHSVNSFENILVLARVLAIACAERKGQKEDRPDVEPIFWHALPLLNVWIG